MQVSSSEAFSFLKWIVYRRFYSHYTMCPVFIGSLMKPLSTSFQRFSPVIVNCLEQPSVFSTLFGCAGLIVFRPMLGGTAVFPLPFFAGGPDVNFDKFTTCFSTFCRAPRSCSSDIFALIFLFHDARFIIALCLLLMYYLHL